jgi:predicted Zn-ribbon and HTH transcriptional regulator
MSRPTLEVADIIQAQGNRFLDGHRDQVSYQQLKVLRAIARCRTAALGGHIDDCPRCGHKAISYNSCRNRHCPKCQAQLHRDCRFHQRLRHNSDPVWPTDRADLRKSLTDQCSTPGQCAPVWIAGSHAIQRKSLT